MSEITERVGAAIIQALVDAAYIEEPFDSEASKLAARAAIEAMRDPTGKMKDAGAQTYGVHSPAIGFLPLSVIDGQPTKAWQAMIDEALK